MLENFQLVQENKVFLGDMILWCYSPCTGSMDVELLGIRHVCRTEQSRDELRLSDGVGVREEASEPLCIHARRRENMIHLS